MTTEWLSATAALRDWLTAQELGVTIAADGFSVDDGEVRLDVAIGAASCTVRKTWRDEDRGILMSSPLWEDVDRFLTITYANSARARLRFRPLRPIARPATGPGAVADGFDLRGDLDRGFELTGPLPGGTRTLHFSSDIDAAKFSRYGSYTPDELRARASRESADLLA